MKRLILLAAICCVVIPVNGQQPGKYPNGQQKDASNSQQPKNETISVDTVNINKLNVQQQTGPTNNSDKDAKKPPSYLSRLIAPENLPNLVLCAVGIAGVIVAVCTLGAIRRQANLMEKHAGHLKNLASAASENATAGRLNAEAILNAERAWMVGTKPSYRLITGGGKVKNIDYVCQIKNVGKTLCRILEVGITLRKTESFDKIPVDPTLTYKTGEIKQFSKIVVVPDESIPVSAQLSDELSWEEYAVIKDCKLFIYGYGFVKYLDVLDNPRENRFCHYYRIAVSGAFSERDVFTACIQAPRIPRDNLKGTLL